MGYGVNVQAVSHSQHASNFAHILQFCVLNGSIELVGR